jgi:phosphopantetheinyl transferase (holo-ACP synthase)
VAFATLTFSLTRSGDLCAIAVSQRQLIGVDIERIAKVYDPDRIAGQLFGPAEMAILARLSDELRLRAFLAAWTQKEAYAKAIGIGLQISLQGLPRFINVTNQQRLSPVECENGAGWHMAALRPPEEFVGALALCVGYSCRRIRIFHRNYPAGSPATQSEICQRTELTPGATADRTDGFACFWSRAHHVWRDVSRAFNRKKQKSRCCLACLGKSFPTKGEIGCS